MAVAAVDVLEHAIGPFEDPHPQRHEHVGRGALGDVPVDVAHRRRRLAVPREHGAHVRQHRGHVQRRRHAVAGHVAEADADAVLIQREDVEEVAGDELARLRLHREAQRTHLALARRAKEGLRLACALEVLLQPALATLEVGALEVGEGQPREP